MLKYFIYQLKNNYKILVVNIVVIAILAQLFKEGIIMTAVPGPVNPILIPLLLPGTILLGFSIMFSLYKAFDIVSGDFFRNTGYFTYTLPIKSYKILFSKIFFAMFYLITVFSTFTIQVIINVLYYEGIKGLYLPKLEDIGEIIEGLYYIKGNMFISLAFVIFIFVLVKVYLNSKFYAILLTIAVATIISSLRESIVDLKLYNYNIVLTIYIIISIILVLIAGRLLDKKLNM